MSLFETVECELVFDLMKKEVDWLLTCLCKQAFLWGRFQGFPLPLVLNATSTSALEGSSVTDFQGGLEAVAGEGRQRPSALVQ